jgi:LPXTG-site transpeptidase (sortase) family protein
MTRVRLAIVAVMVVAVMGAAGGAAYLMSYHVSEPALDASPPLALGGSPLPAASASSGPAGPTPLTTRLVIPAAKIDIRVIQGDGKTVQMHLAMHYPGTDQPGGGSNALFYAHAQPGMFQGLYQLHIGDHIQAIRSDGSSVSYHVTAFEKVGFDDRNVLNPTPFDQITLLTCVSYNPYDPRFIVIGLPDGPAT